jgi:soluble lytic murein transglycosylase-like protein
MRRKDKLKEYLTGILLGLIFSIIFFCKLVFASPVEEVEIPKEVEFWCEKYGEEYDICPETLEAICWVESRCIPTVQSPDKSCKGLMQIKPACHRNRMERLGVQNIFGTWENIKTGTDYLAELRDEYGDIAAALYAYNGNTSGAEKYLKTQEATGYAKKVLEISAELEERHE